MTIPIESDGTFTLYLPWFRFNYPYTVHFTYVQNNFTHQEIFGGVITQELERQITLQLKHTLANITTFVDLKTF